MHPYCILNHTTLPHQPARLLRLLFALGKQPQPLVLLQFLRLLRSALLSSLPSAGHEFNRLKVCEQCLASLLNGPTKDKVEHHGDGELDSELERSHVSHLEDPFFQSLTEVVISTNCNHRFNSGTKSVAPQ